MNRLFLIIISILSVIQSNTQYSFTTVNFKRDKIIECKINNHKLDFTFDTGAELTTISEELEEVLKKDKFIKEEDYIGEGSAILPNGDKKIYRKVLLKEIEVGKIQLNNVIAYIIPNGGSLLFGKSAINKFDGLIINDKNITVFDFSPKKPTYKKEKNILIDNRDGNKYKTVNLGGLTWMAENLRFKAYKMEEFVTKYKSYRLYKEIGNPYEIPKYGYFYTYEQSKNVCPVGWHLPTYKDYYELEDFFDIGKDYLGLEERPLELLSKKGWYFYDEISESNSNKIKGPKKISFNAFPTGAGYAENAFFMGKEFVVEKFGREAIFWLNPKCYMKNSVDNDLYFKIRTYGGKTNKDGEAIPNISIELESTEGHFKMTKIHPVRCVKDN